MLSDEYIHHYFVFRFFALDSLLITSFFASSFKFTTHYFFRFIHRFFFLNSLLITFFTHYFFGMVREKGLEPLREIPPDPKSGASANSATPAAHVAIIAPLLCFVKQTEAGAAHLHRPKREY